jgi:ribonuclease Z
MDTGLCDAAFELAKGADLVVCEATFASAEADLARRYHHLTAAQAGRIAAEAGARRLVISHFSQRYPDESILLDEARAEFDDVIAARDGLHVPVPSRVAHAKPEQGSEPFDLTPGVPPHGYEVEDETDRQEQV